jgi:hemolysin activation/secretion protein
LLLLLVEQSALARVANNATPPANQGTNQTKAPAFAVLRYDVVGNTLLRPEVIDRIFTNAVGPAITVEQIRKALGELQLAYRERGYVTVALTLPQQQITNGTIRIDVTEARLVAIKVKGNSYFSSNNVLRDLPSLRTNILLNSQVFQRELDEANLNRDRQIYPSIEPGPLPGTSALVLNVKDRFPLHARTDVDDYNTPGTPDLRINLSLQYDNLWQLNHQIGVSYGFSPEKEKAGGLMPNYFFDEPAISYYGAYYRIPFGAASVEDEIGHSTAFGYNEASHQFVSPPSGNRPDLTFYASASASDTGVKFGDLETVTTGPSYDVQSQTSGRNLGINEGLGGRFTLPINTSDKVHWDFFGGVDWKEYALTTYSTNSFIQTYLPQPGTGPVPPAYFNSASPPLRSAVDYLPLNLGVDFSESDSQGSSSASLTGSYNFSGGAANFASLAYSTEAREHFSKLNFSFSRDQKLPDDFSLLLRGSGQAATGALISNEQFPLGGINSVRGYFEGDEYGDAGWFGSLEVRTPYNQTRVASINDFVPAWARASVFVDSGQSFLLNAPAGASGARTLLGTGFGVSGNINNHIDVRLTVAWPLLNSVNTQAPNTHVYFTIGGQF